MKIAFIVESFPEISETFIQNQVAGLKDSGQQVYVYARSKTLSKKLLLDAKQKTLISNLRHCYTVPSSKTLCRIKAILLASLYLIAAPVKTQRLLKKLMSSKKGFSYANFFFALKFLRSDFDIIHCHFGPFGILGTFLKSIGIPGKLCTTFHGYDLSNYLIDRPDDIYDELFQMADLLLPISEFWKKKLVEMKCDPDKICIHHMGVDLDRFSFSERKWPKDQIVKILTIGRLTEKKGHEYAIKAVAKLIELNYKVQYLIAGDGPLKEDLISLAANLGISDIVKFIGAVKHEDVNELFNSSDIFLLPSVTSGTGDMEGIPVVLMESMAMGLPVVSTYHSGIPELITNDISGCLVPERDSDAIVEKISYLVENSDIALSMRKQGRKVVEKCFNIKTLNQRLISKFQKLCDNA